jgi:hypothetical protein
MPIPRLRYQHFVDIFAIKRTLSALSERRSRPWAKPSAFDRLFDCAKLHVQAGVMVLRPWAFETIVMAVLLEQEKRIEQLLKRLEALQRRGITP